MTQKDYLVEGARIIVRGQAWTVVRRTTFADCASVSLRGCGSDNGGSTRTLLAPFDRFRPAERPVRHRVVRARLLLHELRSAVFRAHPLGGLTMAAHSALQILPYQLEPALAVAAGVTRLMIADAVGLGKTIQAALILTELAARVSSFRALIATPAGLREQWQRELDRHVHLQAVIADAGWLARVGRDLPSDVNPWTLPAVVIASYDFLKRPEVLRPLEDVTWDALIVDEAHNAAHGTARRAALHAIGLRSRRVVLLTATPHAGDQDVYEALARLGAPDADRGPVVTFRRTRCEIEGALARRTAVLAVRPSPAEERMHRLLEAYTTGLCREAAAGGDHRARLAAIVLRKRALSSAASLATSVSRRLALLLGAPAIDAWQIALPFADEDPLDDVVADGVLAAPGMADAARERALLNAIAENAHAAAKCESKLRFLLRLLMRAREPAIVFTEYRDTLARIQGALGRFGFRALTLHGGQSPSERAAIQRQFNAGGSLLLATDAAAEGLNLQARCRVVIHYELPWTPARLEQRTGRVDRIGQERRVHEILLVARDTAERMVLAPLAARAARAGITVDGHSHLLEVLTESRVAAAVMEGLPLTDPAAREPAPAAQTPWASAAAAEAERLRGLRRLPPDCLHHAPDNDVLICAPARHALRRRVTAVYASELVSGSGRVEHADMLAARMTIRPVAVRRSVRSLKEWVSVWLREAEPGVRDSLAATQYERLTTFQRRFEKAGQAVEQRERDIASARPSAARELVQAGLFERRALRAADARRRGADERLEAAQLRRAETSAGLNRRLRLRAVILQ